MNLHWFWQRSLQLRALIWFDAHAGGRTRVTSMGGLHGAATLRALLKANLMVLYRDARHVRFDNEGMSAALV